MLLNFLNTSVSIIILLVLAQYWPSTYVCIMRLPQEHAFLNKKKFIKIGSLVSSHLQPLGRQIALQYGDFPEMLGTSNANTADSSFVVDLSIELLWLKTALLFRPELALENSINTDFRKKEIFVSTFSKSWNIISILIISCALYKTIYILSFLV